MEKANEHARLNEKKWDLRAETFDDRRFDYFRIFQRGIASLLDLKENQRLLDLGCGTGRAVRYAASLANGRGEFYGIDISSKMIEKAEASSSNCRNIHFHKASADKLPFDNNFFDSIICSNSFHHYFNPDDVLREVYRVLKLKGRIYILDPTADGFIMRVADKWIKSRELEHVRFYSTQEYGTLFAKAGLSYVAGKSITSPVKVLFIKVHIGGKC